MAARVAQSAVQLIIATNPSARIAQSVLQLILIPAPAPSTSATPFRPLGGGGMIEEQCCPIPDPKPRLVDESLEAPEFEGWMVQSIFHRRH